MIKQDGFVLANHGTFVYGEDTYVVDVSANQILREVDGTAFHRIEAKINAPLSDQSGSVFEFDAEGKRTVKRFKLRHQKREVSQGSDAGPRPKR